MSFGYALHPGAFADLDETEKLTEPSECPSGGTIFRQYTSCDPFETMPESEIEMLPRSLLKTSSAAKSARGTASTSSTTANTNSRVRFITLTPRISNPDQQLADQIW